MYREKQCTKEAAEKDAIIQTKARLPLLPLHTGEGTVEAEESQPSEQLPTLPARHGRLGSVSNEDVWRVRGQR